MFYYNARWVFALPKGADAMIPGGIIAASSLPMHTLLRRGFARYPYLQHRFFDPQLYLAGLHADRSEKEVINLSSYGWFPTPGVPEYDSSIHGTQADWKMINSQALCSAWAGRAASHPEEIGNATRAAIELQVRMGFDAVILPSPLTRAVNDYEEETRWLDIGLAVCRELRVSLPIFATVAISDIVIRGNDPQQNPFLQLITDQVSAREINGVYIVVEQAATDGYCCHDEDTLLGVLTLVDDLVRGAGLRVVTNYIGSFGPVAHAAGAEVWSTGYYLGQRRLRLSAMEVEDEEERRAYPRYFSAALAGDIGLQRDMDRIIRAGLGPRLFANTNPARPLHQALSAGASVADVPAWQHRISNIQAAAAHYVEVMRMFSGILNTRSPSERVGAVHFWLRRAADLAETVRDAGVRSSRNTELTHQRAWLRSYERWMNVSGKL